MVLDASVVSIESYQNAVTSIYAQGLFLVELVTWGDKD